MSKKIFYECKKCGKIMRIGYNRIRKGKVVPCKCGEKVNLKRVEMMRVDRAL